MPVGRPREHKGEVHQSGVNQVTSILVFVQGEGGRSSKISDCR
jgi:hypothetical protein